MHVKIVDIVLIVLFVQIISLLPYLLVQRWKNLPNRFLALFLLAKALCISNFLCFRLMPVSLEYVPHLFFIGSSFTILWGPLLYFYTRSLSEQDFSFSKYHLLHFIPFLLHLSYFTINFHWHSAEVKRALITSGTFPGADLSRIIFVGIHGTIFLYTLVSFWLVWKYRIFLKDHFSKLGGIRLSWLVFVICGFSIKWGFDMWYAFENLTGGNWGSVALGLSRLTLFLFINIMIYFGLNQSPVLVESINEIKDSKRSLSDDLLDKYAARLSSYMDLHKPYLEPDITLIQLSDMVRIPPRSLSEVLNKALGKNFYDFINSYRIKESKRLLAEHSAASVTVLEILYRVGYNSKSSFNAAFKKHVGMTPSQYKSQISV